MIPFAVNLSFTTAIPLPLRKFSRGRLQYMEMPKLFLVGPGRPIDKIPGSDGNCYLAKKNMREIPTLPGDGLFFIV